MIDSTRVLLIEDNVADAVLMRTVVRRCTRRSFLFTHAETLSAALEALAKEDFDVVILDQFLPDAEGTQAVARLRRLSQCPPIIMLTGASSDQQVAERAIAAGAQDFLCKSDVDGKGLIRSIRYAIERHASEAQLHALATIDTITGLPNRSLFQQLLQQAIEEANRTQSPAALLYLDLDGFKDVNDSLGHDAGDELLAVTAQRLQKRLREGDHIGRLGGDEFAVLVRNVKESNASSIAQDLVDITSTPILMHNTEIRVTASIGIATTRTTDTADGLMRQADMAMYAAKRQGGCTWRYFEPRLQVEVDHRMLRQAELRKAFEQGDFRLHYQPIVNLNHERPIGYEALARWARGDGVEVGGSFIPDIEQGNLAIPFGCWVIQQACEQLARAAAMGSTAYIAVNVCARQVLSHSRETSLVQAVRDALESTGAPASQLVVEVTEGMFVHDLDRTSGMLQELRQLGVRVAIDDFGTGYCSLQYLARLPVDTLKIDGSFVKASKTPRGRALLQAIVDLGTSVGMEMVAEWVETQEEAAMLRGMGCELAQGWHFGAATPAHEITWSTQQATPLPPLRLLG